MSGRPAACALGAGGWVCYAPPRPRWWERPGFFDEAHVLNAALAPVHTWALALPAPNGVAAPALVLRPRRAGALAVEARGSLALPAGGRVEIAERREVLPGDRLRSTVRLALEGRARAVLGFFAFTCAGPLDGAPRFARGVWRVRRELSSYRFPPVAVRQLFRAPGAEALPARRLEAPLASPDWCETPWWDEGLDAEVLAGRRPKRRRGLGLGPYLALGFGRRLVLGRRARVLVVETEIALSERPAPAPRIVLPAGRYAEFRAAFPKLAADHEAAVEVFERRLELLQLHRVPGGKGWIPEPAICEGPGFFREPIAYSAPALAREARWHARPKLALGCLRGFLRAAPRSGRERGRIPGRLYLRSLAGADFYFGDFGRACRAVLARHPNARTRRGLAAGVAAFARWVARRRDPRNEGLVGIASHFETGQEFSPRYTAADPQADRDDWLEAEPFLQGVDATVYHLGDLEFATEASRWAQRRLMRVRAALAALFDPRAGLYCDRNPRTARSTGVRAAVGFYPLLSDVPDESEVRCLLRALADPEDFGTPFPVPSLAPGDRGFDPNARWQGLRRVCPWNGRVWPMLNSHVIEGLAATARRTDLPAELRERAARLAARILDRTLALFAGSTAPWGPTSCEHYHPFSGRPSLYRAVGGYLHCWILDQILTGLCGLVPEAGGFRLAPLPLAGDFRVELGAGPRRLRLERRGRRLFLTLGRRRALVRPGLFVPRAAFA